MDISRMSLAQAGEYLCKLATDEGYADLANELRKLFFVYKDLDIAVGVVNAFEIHRDRACSDAQLKTAVQHKGLEVIQEAIPLPLYYGCESPGAKRLEKHSLKMVKPPAPLAMRPFLATPVKGTQDSHSVQDLVTSPIENSGSSGFSATSAIFSPASLPGTPNSVMSTPTRGPRYIGFEGKLIAPPEEDHPARAKRAFSSSSKAHPIGSNLGPIVEDSEYKVPNPQLPTHLDGDDVFGSISSFDGRIAAIRPMRSDSPSSEYSRGIYDYETPPTFLKVQAGFQSFVAYEYAMLASTTSATYEEEPTPSPKSPAAFVLPPAPSPLQSTTSIESPCSPTPSRTSFMDKEISFSFSVNGLVRSASVKAKRASYAVIHGTSFKGHKRSASVSLERTQHSVTNGSPIMGHAPPEYAPPKQAEHAVAAADTVLVDAEPKSVVAIEPKSVATVEPEAITATDPETELQKKLEREENYKAIDAAIDAELAAEERRADQKPFFVHNSKAAVIIGLCDRSVYVAKKAERRDSGTDDNADGDGRSATPGAKRPASAMAGSTRVDNSPMSPPRARYWDRTMIYGPDPPVSRMEKALGMARKLSVRKSV